MWGQECPAWEVYIAICFEIEVFWNTENDNTAGVMCFPAQESSLFSSQACEYESAAHDSGSTSPPLFIRAKRVCPGFEWCSSVSTIPRWDSYPPHGPYHRSLLGSKADESKWGLMLWKEPAATWFYGLLEDIVMVKDAPGNNIPTTVYTNTQTYTHTQKERFNCFPYSWQKMQQTYKLHTEDQFVVSQDESRSINAYRRKTSRGCSFPLLNPHITYPVKNEHFSFSLLQICTCTF